ncbi:histidinol phosphate aminotransferase apoenzyme [Desulfobulbus propionicus DSM 2032]|jgi:histidinol-phosphate aminotransferase|uniref:Histidinol-phosphate aminotransferase n=1 Tax=Desulfobulbus propionicus (strain ATCC 33891 / DSM 2032 / VKM B-1956 / 1pr3) TaxID=577650 RepID=A0A7U3YQ33_DESPD|nr:histidinol-phosphate transaminase [Desulfobulbus propionicus]ADW19296.1 histidinol phosphate aminotransferase apoenzyme [Desulfobulbus propionicus DSM 2032]
MNLEALIPEYVRGFQAYVPSKPDHLLMREYGAPVLHRLNNNENPLGPPPAAARVIAAFPPERAAVYPSGDCHDLRQALGVRLGLVADRILVGNGSCEVISSVIKAFCQPGDNIITADKTFAVYEWVAEFSGIEARLTPLHDYAFDPQAMLDRIDRHTKILFVCNPNNPTGSSWSRQVLVDFLEQVGDDRIVVVDEAYREYVEDPDYPDTVGLMERFPNLVVFRTFSKMYGLAGLRVGYLAGTEAVVEVVRRTSVAYSVNVQAQQAALAALEDDCEHIAATRALVRQGKAMVGDACRDLGLETVGGEGNYLMIRTPINDMLMYRRLMRRGMMVRTMTGFRFPGWIRVTLREREVMERFVEALAEEVDMIRNKQGVAA